MRSNEPVEHLGDHLVCSAPSRCNTGSSEGSTVEIREQVGILHGVMNGDDPAIGGAEGTERPMVLPQRHEGDQRAGDPRIEFPVGD